MFGLYKDFHYFPWWNVLIYYSLYLKVQMYWKHRCNRTIVRYFKNWSHKSGILVIFCINIKNAMKIPPFDHWKAYNLQFVMFIYIFPYVSILFSSYHWKTSLYSGRITWWTSLTCVTPLLNLFCFAVILL